MPSYPCRELLTGIIPDLSDQWDLLSGSLWIVRVTHSRAKTSCPPNCPRFCLLLVRISQHLIPFKDQPCNYYKSNWWKAQHWRMLIILSPAWQTLKSPSGVEIPLVSSVTSWGSRGGFRKWQFSLLLQMEMSFQLWGHWSRTVPYCTTVVRSRGDGGCSQKLPQCGPNKQLYGIYHQNNRTALGHYWPGLLFLFSFLSVLPQSTSPKHHFRG